MLYPHHAVEVVTLERQPFTKTWRRASALRSVTNGDGILHLLIALLLLVAAPWSVAQLLQTVLSLLAHTNPWPDMDWQFYVPSASLMPHLIAWMLAGYLSVVRYLSYIDLRTRSEGWEVDLALRRATQRLEGA